MYIVINVQGDTQFLPHSLYCFLTCLQKGHNFFSEVCLEREDRVGGRGGDEEENIAKQTDHVLKS